MVTQEKTKSELSTIRDTIESIWIAIVLAFVLRAFLVEAFVIPTGSMAPRLMGEHYVLRCPSCNYEFAFGHSPRERQSEDFSGACCPTCGRPIENLSAFKHVKGGDRVLVLKYPYRFGFAQPKPWDVVVFKNPQDNTQNYIKRLIGLPGETIEIVHGDIFYKSSTDSPWRIRRKPPRAQKAMWQIVFDNDYRPDADRLGYASCPKWKCVSKSDEKNWEFRGHGRNFVFKGNSKWSTLKLKIEPDKFLPHYGYNSPRVEATSQIDLSRDICTDLNLSCTFHPLESDAKIALFLTSIEHGFRAEVHVDGTVELQCTRAISIKTSAIPPVADRVEWYHDAGKKWTLKGKIDPLKVSKAHQLALTHVDFKVTLWVNGQAVLESSDDDYYPDHKKLTQRMRGILDRPIPKPRIRIAVSGGRSELRHVKLMRDVFYTCPYLSKTSGWYGPLGDYIRKLAADDEGWSVDDIDGRSLPGWGVMGRPIELKKHDDPAKHDLDEFYVLGDNSPQSLDSRAWVLAAPSLRLYDKKGSPQYQLGTVPRYNMIGKAFFVYWPAGFSVPGLGGLSVIPNVGKMRLIR